MEVEQPKGLFGHLDKLLARSSQSIASAGAVHMLSPAAPAAPALVND